jgi:hypothetical protein
MRIIAPLLTISCLSLAAQPSVSVVASSESKHAIRAFSASGEVTIPVASLQLDVGHASGKSERTNLVVVYDPQGGYYFWRNTPAYRGPGDTTGWLSAMESGVGVYVGPDAIVDFYMTGLLYAQEHRERANTLDSAIEAAVDGIRRHLPAYERNGYDNSDGGKGIGVGTAIGAGFRCPPFRANCPDVTKVTSVSRQGDTWRLVIQNQWDQEVILDAKFNLVSTRRLSEPPNGGRNQ